MTDVLTVNPIQPEMLVIQRAADCLRLGGLVAFPTETVYGLGAHALDRDAVRRLFMAKGRPANDPVIVHIASVGAVSSLVTEVPAVARQLAERFWPGPLTLVLPKSPSVPPEITAGLPTVAVRIPAHPVAAALLSAAALPVAAPSANLFSRPSPTRASHVMHDLDGRIDMVLDGGPTTVGVESTVVDLTVDPPRVLRPGGISVEALRGIVPAIVPPAVLRPLSDDAPMRAPGLLATHYAPRTPMTLFRGEPARTRRALGDAVHEALAAAQRVGVLATREEAHDLGSLPVHIGDLGPEHDVDRIAAALYAVLRDLDDARLDVILARDFARDDGLWRALRDRLERAAARIVEVS
jgi:L-threonylcarbamoyladenylate synthase